MNTKLFIIFLFSLSSQLFAESHQYVNPWPDAKLKDIELMLKENDKTLGIVKNDDGQFILLKNNKILNGNKWHIIPF